MNNKDTFFIHYNEVMLIFAPNVVVGCQGKPKRKRSRIVSTPLGERQECMDIDTAIEEREIEKEDELEFEKLPKSLADRIRTASISGIDETATLFLRNIPSEVTPWDPASDTTSPVRRLAYLDSKLTQVDTLITRTRRLKMIYAFAFYHEYRGQLLAFWKGRNSLIGDPENAKCKGMVMCGTYWHRLIVKLTYRCSRDIQPTHEDPRIRYRAEETHILRARLSARVRSWARVCIR